MQETQIILRPNAHILIVKLAGIGDLLLATPAIRALRETYPQARIDLLVTPDSAGLLNGWDAIDSIIVLDKYLFDYPQQIISQPQKLFKLRNIWQSLRRGKYDTVILLHHLTLRFGRLKHQMLMRATGARWRVGLDNGFGKFLNVRVKDEGFGYMHEAEYNLALMQAIGAQTSSKKTYVPLTEAERAKARKLVYGERTAKEDLRPIVAIHPGCGGYSTARRWAPERFAQVADHLVKEFGAQILLVGGPEEKELHQEVISLMQNQAAVEARSLAGQGNIKVAAAVLELADLVIGNDSALVHLAAAVETPVVAIFGLTNIKAWGPYAGEETDQRVTIVHRDLPCMPCFYKGHSLGMPEGCATRDCLTGLKINPVVIAARRYLKQAAAKGKHLQGN